MVFVGASVLNVCFFDPKTWGNDSDVLGTVVLSCCQDCRSRIEALEDGLKPWLMTWLYSNILRHDTSWIPLTKPWICRSGSTVLWMDEHLGSLAVRSDEATAQEMKSSWPCSKGFLKGIRNLPDMTQILSILQMRWTKTPPGPLVWTYKLMELIILAYGPICFLKSVLQPPTRLPKACKTWRWCGSSGRCSWSRKHVGCWPNSGRGPQ